MPEESRLIQVNNVAPTATTEQMQALFSHLGKVEEVVMYPEGDAVAGSKVCFVKFSDPDDISVALHITSTVFIDRALTVIPVFDGKIPDEQTALSSQSTGLSAALINGQPPSKGDEILRTVYVGNLSSSTTPDVLLEFFGSQAGEVKFLRMAGKSETECCGAFIEFTELESVEPALNLTGQIIGDQPISVAHANSQIVKQSSSGSAANTAKDIDLALKKVNEAQSLISAAATDHTSRDSRSRSRHRSRSAKKPSRSPSRSRRSKSRGKRSRSRSPRSRRKSRSKSPRKSRSPLKRRNRSRSRSPRRKSRSPRRKSRSPRRKSRSPRRKSRSPRRKSRSPRRRSRSPCHRSSSRNKHIRRRSRTPSPKHSGRSRRSRSRERSRKDDPKARDRSPKDSSGAKGDKDEKSRSKAESSGRRSKSPSRRSAAKRSRSRSHGISRKDQDSRRNSSRERSSRDTGGQGQDKSRGRDRDNDRDHDSKQNKKSSRESGHRDRSTDHNSDKDKPATKKRREEPRENVKTDKDLVNEESTTVDAGHHGCAAEDAEMSASDGDN